MTIQTQIQTAPDPAPTRALTATYKRGLQESLDFLYDLRLAYRVEGMPRPTQEVRECIDENVHSLQRLALKARMIELKVAV